MSRIGARIDPVTGVVWIGMILVGIVGWLASGTAFAGALIVIAVLLATASPAGALYASCAAIPLVFRPIEVGSLQLGLLELGVLATATGFALRILYETVNSGKMPSLGWVQPPLQWVFPGLLFVVGSLSLALMPFELHRAEALRTWRWVIFEPLALFALARWAIARHGRPALAMAIAIPAAVVSAAAVWQLISASSSFSVDGVQRSTGSYLHPNNLALYLERAFYLAFVPAILLGRRVRVPMLTISIVIVLGIVATFSRGAILGLAAGGAVLLLAHPIRLGWRALTWAALTAIGSFLLLAGKRFTGADSSGFLATRGYLWRDSLAMIRDFPISGIGLDQFLWIHQSRYIEPRIWSERYVSHPHNLVLDSWLSLGMAGLFLLVAFVVAGGWVVWQARSGRRELDGWQLGALACLGAGLGHGFVDNGYFLSDLAAMTWLAFALAMSSGSPMTEVAPNHVD